MLTHSYNGIMAPLVMRSWDDHTACWVSNVAVTSSTTREPNISPSLPRCCVYSRREATPSPDLQNEDSSVKSDEGLCGLFTVCTLHIFMSCVTPIHYLTSLSLGWKCSWRKVCQCKAVDAHHSDSWEESPPTTRTPCGGQWCTAAGLYNADTVALVWNV